MVRMDVGGARAMRYTHVFLVPVDARTIVLVEWTHEGWRY